MMEDDTMADEKSMMPELTLDPSRTDAVPQLTLDPESEDKTSLNKIQKFLGNLK